MTVVHYMTKMHTDYTVIPHAKRDSIIEDLKDLQAEIHDPLMDMRLQSIIFRLDCWTHWDPEFLKVVSEAEEEGIVRPQEPEVSDVFTLSV